MRALVLAALMAAPAAAQDRCWLLCDEEVLLEGAPAAERLAGWLGRSVPPGSVVENLIEGGVQDSYLRARLSVDGAGLDAVLKAAGVDPKALAPVATAEGGPDDPAWWDWKLREGVTSAEGSLPALPHATVYVAPEADGRWTLYLWAFQT